MIAAAIAVMTPGYLVISVVAGLIAGLYLAVFHPASETVLRRSLLQGWYFGFLGSILYASRVFFLLGTGTESDVGRVSGGWALWLLFSVAITAGAFVGAEFRERRTR